MERAITLVFPHYNRYSQENLLWLEKGWPDCPLSKSTKEQIMQQSAYPAFLLLFLGILFLQATQAGMTGDTVHAGNALR